MGLLREGQNVVRAASYEAFMEYSRPEEEKALVRSVKSQFSISTLQALAEFYQDGAPGS